MPKRKGGFRMSAPPIRAGHPLSWLFHANTARWAHTAEPPPEDSYPRDPRENPELELVPLPAVEPPAVAFGELLARRCSCRVFRDEAVAVEALGGVLRSAYGVLGSDRAGRLEFAQRPVPSGGGLYPLEASVIVRRLAGLDAGIYHYVAEHHGLERVARVDVPKPLLDHVFMGQAGLTAAPALVVLSGVWERCMFKYGDRAYRYMLFEAGHAMQTLNLAALGYGLGSCNMGGFFDEELGHLLGLDPERETPLYACALGVPGSGTKMGMRDL